MQNKRYLVLLAVVSFPLLAMFTNTFLGQTIGLMWGFLGWLVVINLLIEAKEKKIEELTKEEEEPEKVIEKIMEDSKPTNPFSKV